MDLFIEILHVIQSQHAEIQLGRPSACHRKAIVKMAKRCVGRIRVSCVGVAFPRSGFGYITHSFRHFFLLSFSSSALTSKPYYQSTTQEDNITAAIDWYPDTNWSRFQRVDSAHEGLPWEEVSKVLYYFMWHWHVAVVDLI